MSEQAFYSLDGPLDSMPGETQMRIANLAGFQEFVRELGGEPRALLERHDIAPSALRDPDHFIDCRAVVELLEDASERLHDPLFGLDLAGVQNPDVFGCVAALCRAASSVRESVNSFIEYIPVVHSPVAEMELVEGNSTAELRWYVRSDVGSNNQANLQAVALDMELLKLVSGPRFKASYVNLAVDLPSAQRSRIAERLGCEFRFNREQNAIAFPKAVLDQPVTSASRLLFSLLSGYLDKVKTASRNSIEQRVQDFIRGALPTGHCSIERCAEKFGLSVRMLQLNLARSGIKYSDILEQQRIELACSLLRDASLPLDTVTTRLGYSEQSSFGRAFRRWVGMTPLQYRDRQRRY